MNHTYMAVGLTALGILGLQGCPAQDPGKPGKAHKVVYSIGDGTKISSANYGLWKAGADATEKCRWYISVKGKVAASGGAHDMIISSSGLKGGIVHSGCGRFYK